MNFFFSKNYKHIIRWKFNKQAVTSQPNICQGIGIKRIECFKLYSYDLAHKNYLFTIYYIFKKALGLSKVTNSEITNIDIINMI